MSSSRRTRSVLGSKAAPVFIILCVGCSPDSAPVRGAYGDTGGDAGRTDHTGTDASTDDEEDDEEEGDGDGDMGEGGDGDDEADATVDSPDAGGKKDGGSDGEDGSVDTDDPEGCEVSPITDEMRDSYANMNNAYYQKYASANGVIVATGPKVGDEAIVRYCRLLTEMVSNEEVRRAIMAEKMWFTMISEDEQLSSLPQIDQAYGTSLNRRARGLGGLTPTICAEDSIMCLPGDLWDGDCICPHETGHTLYSSGIAKVPALNSRLRSITASARSSGRLSNAYVWQDGNESGMMAWGVQVWYDCAINGTRGAYHSDINTRAELQKELPDFHQFLSELLPAENEYEDCYSNP